MGKNDSEYTAASIRVLSGAEILERFDWAKIGSLAEQYGKDPEWIERGFQACVDAGVHETYFIRRYLQGDKSMPAHEGVEEAYRQRYVRRARG